MSKRNGRKNSRRNPYARFGRIHEACPDLVNFFHYVENLKPGVRDGIQVAEIKAGLNVLAENCQLLISKVSQEFVVSSEWTESNVPGKWEQVATILADADQAPWSQSPEELIRHGTAQTSELLELAGYAFEVGLAKGDEITLGEMAERIQSMKEVLDGCGDVPQETLGELDERQAAPNFEVEQRC